MLVAQPVRSAAGLFLWVGDCLRGRPPSELTLAVLADRHLVSAYRRYRLENWAVGHTLLSLGFIALLGGLWGGRAVAYLLLSQLFMTGFLHPLHFGMVLSNSHFHFASSRHPTASYYGWWNRLTFNFGYHTEHHDLAQVPWNQLPKLRRLAPDLYDPLVPTESYCRLAWDFLRARI
jgi:sphingolipid delta-4 desaturase